MEWYLKVVRDNYANFNGRARRKEYWMFILINIIISIILSIIDTAMGLRFGVSEYSNGSGVISSVYSLAVLIPSLAVGARRLHDINKSGWWQLLSLIPLVGAIILIVWAATEGDKGPNEYGPDPKDQNANAFSDDDLIDDVLID